MRRKLYTKGHNIGLLKEVDNGGGIFTADEHAYVMEQEFAGKFESRESLVRWYLSESAAKLPALALLIKHIYDNECKHILSLGAGTCVLEYLLKLALPKEVKVVATDFDSYVIEKARILLPDIISVRYDFCRDDVCELQTALGMRFDLAIFLGAAYVMNDVEFVRLFRRLREVGVKQIIDFHRGYVGFWATIRALLLLVEDLVMAKLPQFLRREEEYLGKFHGYSRSRGELRRLYRKAGVKLLKETRCGPYEYVAVLENARR